MNPIYFISGANGSGKTTIIEALAKALPHMCFYDFDSIGVPPDADKVWRQKSMELWIQKLLTAKQPSCLLGQIVLGELLSCPSATQIDKVHFCFLDVSDIERVRRLKQRNTAPSQDILNWASWMRMHHLDPQWEQHVIKEKAWSKLDFSYWDRLNSWDSITTVPIIDTTGFPVEEIAQKVEKWICETA